MIHDMELVKKPMAIDLMMRIAVSDGQTKTEIMRGYPDMVTRTIHYRLCEMVDLGWIEYRDGRISPTSKGEYIYDAMKELLDEVEALE